MGTNWTSTMATIFLNHWSFPVEQERGKAPCGSPSWWPLRRTSCFAYQFKSVSRSSPFFWIQRNFYHLLSDIHSLDLTFIRHFLDSRFKFGDVWCLAKMRQLLPLGTCWKWNSLLNMAHRKVYLSTIVIFQSYGYLLFTMYSVWTCHRWIPWYYVRLPL